MRFRKIIVHVLLFTAIVYLSFDSLIDYSTNAEFRAFIKQVKPDVTIHDLLKDAFSNFLAISIIIYTFYIFIYKLFFIKKRNIRNTLFAIGLSILTFLVVLFVEIAFADSFSFQSANYLSFIFSVFFLGGVGLSIRALVENMHESIIRKEIENENLQSELKLLRAQINPHFLFNAMNNIDSIMRKDIDRASSMLIKLSSQMRYMLYESNTDYIQISSELKFIDDYISLQKLKFKNQELVYYNIDRYFGSGKIPPMLFIPFIENTFKHCSDFKTNGAIKIIISRMDNYIIFTSENLYEDKEGNTSGIGIELTKKRLQLLLPRKHELKIEQEQPTYKVTLKVLIDED